MLGERLEPGWIHDANCRRNWHLLQDRAEQCCDHMSGERTREQAASQASFRLAPGTTDRFRLRRGVSPGILDDLAVGDVDDAAGVGGDAGVVGGEEEGDALVLVQLEHQLDDLLGGL